MKNPRYLFIYLLCSFVSLLFFSACSDEEETPLSIHLEEICKVYKGDALRIFLNGEEYSSAEETVKILLPADVSGSIVPYAVGDEASSGEQVKLQFMALWPRIRYSNSSPLHEFDDFLMDAELTSTPEEICLQGVYRESGGYVLEADGTLRDDVFTLHLTYSTDNFPAGHAYLFDFSSESIDLVFLHPTGGGVVEYNGEEIPVHDFVRDAMTPVFREIRNRLGGSLRIAFFPDGTTDVGIQKDGEDGITPVVGKHGFRFHSSNYGYLFTDKEGADWMNKAVYGREFVGISGLYGWRARDNYFASVFYSPRDNGIAMTIESPLMSQFCAFLSYWYQVWGTWDFGANGTLSREETEKVMMIINMILDKQLKLICLRGVEV